MTVVTKFLPPPSFFITRFSALRLVRSVSLAERLPPRPEQRRLDANRRQRRRLPTVCQVRIVKAKLDASTAGRFKFFLASSAYTLTN